MAAVTPLLSARQLVVGYRDHTVLQGASLVLEPGRRMALLGANGSGKTTLMRSLSGAILPDGGVVELDGRRLEHSRAGLRAHRRQVQLVLQDPDDQLFSADVTQDVSFGPMNLGLEVDEVRRRVADALAVMGVTHLADRPTHQLSYGERKRVATAGAVAMAPRVLMLDEPTAGLDPVGVHEVLAAVEELVAGGTTVLLATHDVDLALAWADDAAIVVGGRVQQGPAPDVLADDALLRAARMQRPWPLELASRLGLPGPSPRTLDDVQAALVTRMR